MRTSKETTVTIRDFDQWFSINDITISDSNPLISSAGISFQVFHSKCIAIIATYSNALKRQVCYKYELILNLF